MVRWKLEVVGGTRGCGDKVAPGGGRRGAVATVWHPGGLRRRGGTRGGAAGGYGNIKGALKYLSRTMKLRQTAYVYWDGIEYQFGEL